MNFNLVKAYIVSVAPHGGAHLVDFESQGHTCTHGSAVAVTTSFDVQKFAIVLCLHPYVSDSAILMPH